MVNKLKIIIDNDRRRKQITKFLYAAIMCIGLLLFVEGLFQIPAINNLFTAEQIAYADDQVWMWILLWLLMFAQVTIIPIPAMPIYILCSGIPVFVPGNNLVDLFSLKTFVILLTY